MMPPSRWRLRLSGGPTGARAIGLVVALLLVPSAARPADLDGDGVLDPSDNCPANVNPHQENSDGSGTGDVCDPAAINAILERIAAPGSDYHGRTPYYRMKFSAALGLQLSREGGLGAAANKGIGVPGADDSGVVRLSPNLLIGPTGGPYPAVTPILQQSTWQSLRAAPVFSPSTGAAVPAYVASYANGVAVAYELDPSAIPSGVAAGIRHDLVLPSGWSLDSSELGPGGGIGRLTILDASATPRLRIGTVGIVAFGRQTVLANSPSFFGLTRLSEELQASAATASVGPNDLVGSNFYGGVEGPLIETSYTLRENLADSASGTTNVMALGGSAYSVTMMAPAAVIDRNRATSSKLLIGWQVSSLTPVALDAVAQVHGRHIVFFDGEPEVAGNDIVITLVNVQGTFDGSPPDYALLPNNGGTAALYDVASQEQTAFGCAGCTMTLTGDAHITFVGGGAGVGIGPGPRVYPPEPCLVTDPINPTAATGRCAVGINKRGSFHADRLTVQGSMTGLMAGESDVTLNEFVFHQQHDPNVTDPTLLHGVVGLGCGSDTGVRIGVNPSNGDVMGNVPFDLSSCPPGTVGQGTCLPPALSMSAASGICNLTALRVELVGMGSTTNPLGTDLTMPSGVGVALHKRQGKGQIGGRSFNPGTSACEGGFVAAASEVRGFEVMASFSGGANVNPTNGAPLVAADPGAVPPSPSCIDNVFGDELGVGLVVAPNADVGASHLQIVSTLMGAIQIGNGAANVATLASTTAAGAACRSIDGLSCVTPVQELACPDCKQGGQLALAVASSGKTARTKLHVSASALGLDGLGGVSSGGNPALPPLVLDSNLVATGGGVTIARRRASLFRTPVQVFLGPDTMFAPELLALTLTGNNIGVDAAAISIDNLDSAGGTKNFTLQGNCYTPDGANCITAASGLPVLAAAASDATVLSMNGTALANAASTPNVVPEPSLLLALASGVVLLAVLHAHRTGYPQRGSGARRA
jgi:hypothetical protein